MITKRRKRKRSKIEGERRRRSTRVFILLKCVHYRQEEEEEEEEEEGRRNTHISEVDLPLMGVTGEPSDSQTGVSARCCDAVVISSSAQKHSHSSLSAPRLCAASSYELAAGGHGTWYPHPL